MGCDWYTFNAINIVGFGFKLNNNAEGTCKNAINIVGFGFKLNNNAEGTCKNAIHQIITYAKNNNLNWKCIPTVIKEENNDFDHYEYLIGNNSLIIFYEQDSIIQK